MTLFDVEEVAVVVVDAPTALSRPGVTTGAVDEEAVGVVMPLFRLLPSALLLLTC